MIFFIRFITAACLFIFLGKANIWLNPFSNVILAIGYRFFLIISPIFSKLAGSYAIAFALIFSVIGTLLFCVKSYYLLAIGAILVSIGFSVSGYLIKATVSETPAGAAHNKIALNIGSLFSGLILLITIDSKNLFFITTAIILLITALISIVNAQATIKNKNINININNFNINKINFKKYIGWLLIGMAIGIKLFGVFSILPQYILNYHATLPAWYGLMLFMNSAIIILLQLPIIHGIARCKYAFTITLIIMLLGMGLIALPQLFHAYNFWGALLWTMLLSIIECCASYLDVQGSRAGYLFIKEIAVGLGAGLTVFFSRYFSIHYSSLLIGLSGIIIIFIAVFLLRNDFKDKIYNL